MISRNIHIILFSLFVVVGVTGQNIHFAQYYDHATLFNAAYATDLQPRGTELGAIYRDQAFTASSNSFRTFAADAKMGLFSNDDFNKVGVSLNVLHDRVGTGSLVANQAYLGLGFQAGNRSQRIAIGGQAGFVQRAIGDVSSFTFEEEILGTGGGDFSDYGSAQYLDFNGGLLYTFLTEDESKLSLGFSLQNINNGSSVSGEIDKYKSRMIGMASFLYVASRRLNITPRAVYQRTRRAASQLNFQTELSYATGRYSDTRIYGALGWRVKDAAQLIVGMEGSNWKSGLAYEINTSAQRKATGLASALELSFIYRQQRKKKKKKEEPIILPPVTKILLSTNIEGVENLDNIEYILSSENDTLSSRVFDWPNIDSLEIDTEYKIFVTKENYSVDSIMFNTNDVTSDTTIYKLLKLSRVNPPMDDSQTTALDSSQITSIDSSSITTGMDTSLVNDPPTKIIYKDVPIILEKIFYDFDDAGILPESEEELTDLYNVLIQHPDIKIELSSHTDIHGSHAYNNRLSQQRANAATRWLIDKGIAKDRIVSKGYGETRLINHCKEGTPCSEELHRQNRRTEFKIIEGPLFIRVPVNEF